MSDYRITQLEELEQKKKEAEITQAKSATEAAASAKK